MKTWRATIKERGNDHLLHPEYMFPDEEPKTEQDMIEFWGLNEPDVEWYKLELV